MNWRHPNIPELRHAVCCWTGGNEVSQLALARLLHRQFDLLTRLTWPQAHLGKHETLKAKNFNKSRIRSRVEHVFGVVKRLWSFGKVRRRGLAKNATGSFTALALANISRSWPMAQRCVHVGDNGARRPEILARRATRGGIR